MLNMSGQFLASGLRKETGRRLITRAKKKFMSSTSHFCPIVQERDINRKGP